MLHSKTLQKLACGVLDTVWHLIMGGIMMGGIIMRGIILFLALALFYSLLYWSGTPFGFRMYIRFGAEDAGRFTFTL